MTALERSNTYIEAALMARAAAHERMRMAQDGSQYRDFDLCKAKDDFSRGRHYLQVARRLRECQ
jgi:hypothetical protein